MAEALLEILVENLNSFARSELATFCGVNGEIERLTRSLTTIQAVIVDAEKKEITDESIKIWLQQLKDAAHVLDDILDDYSIRSPPQYCFSLSSFKPNNIWFRYRIGKRLKDISQRLDQISEDRNRHHFFQREVVIREGPIQVPEWRHTGFVIQSKKVYGRDGDKRKIVELLKHDREGLFVYPIVGLGGLGKTTLAQLVFNDPEVINHFNSFRIWICISDDFSVIRILQSIMESLTSQKCDTSNLATLQRDVQEKLQSVRYLLVLDDVWNQDQDRWYQLRCVLECGSNGASVLVTTRDSNIASFMRTFTTDDHGCMRFKMHDLVHDLAQSITEKECCVMKDGDITNLPRSTRHIGIPTPICSLRKLEIFKLEHCRNLGRLPEGLTNLQNLRHLIIILCSGLSHMPPGIGKLSGLRTLNLFIVRSEEGHSLKELHDLNLCQRELSIKGLECVGNVEEAKGVNLIGKKELRVLSLRWGYVYSGSEIKPMGVDAEQVIEALKPHSNLMKLEVWGYIGSHFPSWMKDVSCINNLVSLKLEDFSNCVQLPALGKLPSLEKLEIKGMECVEYMDDDECYDGVEAKAFVSLKTLQLYRMPKLERLLKRDGGEMFPHLHKLRIFGCPKLTLPCLPSVEELFISRCEEELVESISSLCGLKSLTIFECLKLKELPTQLKSLHTLEELVLFGCDELECIPEQVLEALNSLRTLEIHMCRALKCLPEAIQHLTSLERLSIRHLLPPTPGTLVTLEVSSPPTKQV
ncbi:putative disease resistance protein RGA1 [Senna tora]|uniref:Putative disease resistance protein RGA1 n=1 Tax=Senna tora TaxID=362788 RepID=A0A834T3M6_9FABA|nr:putative disease resistance protein RGA1 [Senna tora]